MTIVPDYDIQAALNDRLNDEFPTMPTAWENTGYTPTVGTAYFAAHLLRAEPDILTLGPTPYQERKGIFQVSCFYPALAGWGAVTSKAAEVVAAFPASSSFVYNGLTVNIEKTWLSNGLPQDGWFMVPVSVKFNCVYKG
jgi:hypothetical protein